MSKEVLVALCLIVCGISLVSKAAASEPINVLVAMSPAAMQKSDPIVLASRFENAANIVLAQTGMTGKVANFYAYPYPTTYGGDNAGFSTAQAIEFLRDGVDQALTQAREALVPLPVNGFDVVVHVVDGFGSTPLGDSCGAGTLPTEYTVAANSEENAFIVYDVDIACTLTNVAYIFPHEFGHVLGAEHQQPAYPGINPDNNWEDPVNYNHPVSIGDDYTIMASRGYVNDHAHYQYSRSDFGTLGSTNVMSGDSIRDNHKLFSQDTWEIVAAYRPLGPPSPKSCTAVVMFCNGSTVVHAFTPYINEPYQITNVRLETRYSPSQSWLPGYDGPFTCPTKGASRSYWYRMLIDTAFGTATCGEHYVSINPFDPCDEEEW